MATQKSPSLAKVLKYKNKNLVQRFSEDYGLSLKETNTIFLDLLRFLWLSHRIILLYKKNGNKSSISSLKLIGSWLIIDEMWHTFLLFSVDYQKFGNKYFGNILHHNPNITGNDSSLKKSTEVDMDLYVDLIYDTFGPVVARRWFIDYEKKYTKDKILSLQLRALRASKRKNKNGK